MGDLTTLQHPTNDQMLFHVTAGDSLAAYPRQLTQRAVTKVTWKEPLPEDDGVVVHAAPSITIKSPSFDREGNARIFTHPAPRAEGFTQRDLLEAVMRSVQGVDHRPVCRGNAPLVFYFEGLAADDDANSADNVEGVGCYRIRYGT